MKKISIMASVLVIFCLILAGCGSGEKATDNSAESAQKVMEKGPSNASEWAAMIPDFEKIFKNGRVTDKFSGGSIEDKTAGAMFCISGVTKDEYDKYVSKAEALYPSVMSQSIDELDGEPYGIFYAEDKTSTYTILVDLYTDPDTNELVCDITCAMAGAHN